MKKRRNIFDRYISRGLIILLRIYQKTLSFDHSWLKHYFPYKGCKFYPTCSEYACQALEKKGVRSLSLILKRLGRCHPWSEGGVDKVPK